ncbi:MAG TPA: aspartate kinase [Clostridiaceae bacterium]|nr:aspartate kinase [Clostridiaceae bacterium]
MKVAKFGGTSLASAGQIKKVCNIILSDPERQIIVVSAPGKRDKNDTKVTDMLIACAESYLANGNADEETEKVVTRYAEIAQELGLSNEIVDAIRDDIKERLKITSSGREGFIDSLKAAGEDNCAKLVAAYLQSIGVDAKYINPKDAGLILSNEYGNAQVLPQSYDNLKSLKNIPGIKIFPGFFGYSLNGEIVTFSRGGSDITGSILAAAVNADLYENYTDVDCVYSVNPNIVPNPQPIREITYREMRELSYAGFSVFHEEALVPVYRKGVPVRIKNTNNPDAPGTTIVLHREKYNGPVVGIAGDKGFCTIYISKYLMNREIGFGRKVLQILEDEGLSYEHIPSGIDHMSIVMRESQLTKDIEKRVIRRIYDELAVDHITVEHDQALIMIVGEGMQRTIGIAARITGALARASVNIEMINQGSSEESIMIGVRADDCTKAIQAIYHEFFK